MLLINGNWQSGRGEAFSSEDPSTGETIWNGREANAADVAEAIASAKSAAAAWSNTPYENRLDAVRRFEQQLTTNLDSLAHTISREVGKPLWEAKTEVQAMIGKVSLSDQAMRARRWPTADEAGGIRAATRYKPHGVAAVFGAFNFPGHVANGHIIPALLAGNSVVFKPSELTPRFAEETVELWAAAGLPAGVMNLLQGGRATGEAIVAHRDVNAVMFTGSHAAGLAIRRALVDRLETMLALELGGNNALVVDRVADVDAAVYWTLQAAYITAGQRCTCARRLIVTKGNDAFIERLIDAIPQVRVAAPNNSPEPFMGPLVHATAAHRVCAAQDALQESGAEVIVPVRRLDQGPAFLAPGMVDVTSIKRFRLKESPDPAAEGGQATDAARDDCEIFGPLLQLIRVDDLDAAINEANQTRYGLVSALFSDDREAFDHFATHIHSGLINWNRPTSGASGKLPFGGVGWSGNFRPAGYFAADFSNIAIGSLQSDKLTIPKSRTPGLDF